MSRSLEIDQSVKIEQLSRDTAIGLSNGTTCVALLPSQVKRKLQSDFRHRNKRQLFRLRSFAAGVVLLLQHAKISHSPHVIIDEEYRGYDRDLVSMVLEMWARDNHSIPIIEIRRIGKRSPAHWVANQTVQGKRNPDYIVTYDEIRRLALR